MIDTTVNRYRFSAWLRPALGSRFQPTGFPDLGAAEFISYRPDKKDGEVKQVRSLLVESTQSMANRLENTAWDAVRQAPVELIAALPYVEVRHQEQPDDVLTSSRLEAHRLSSPFVREATLDGRPMLDVIQERLGLANHRPLNYPAMARTLMSIDPFVLLHGCFFNQKAWYGQPRFARAVSGAIEAYDIEQAVSGGRKSDHVQHSSGKQDSDADDAPTLGGSSEGYGSIPFHRVEYTAREIEAQFSVDVQLLRSYRLTDEQTELLTALTLWEIRTFLDSGLRLRTACDLELADETVTGPIDLPDAATLALRIAELMPAATAPLDHTGALTVIWNKQEKEKKKPSGRRAPAQRSGQDELAGTATS